MVGPGALPLYPHRFTTLPGISSCFTGSAIKWNSLAPSTIRQGSRGTSGVSTEAMPLPCRVAWSMCALSMLSPFACVGVASKRDEAAQPAPRPKAFLRKSRLFFMGFSSSRVNGSTVFRRLNGIGANQDHRQATDTRHRGYTGLKEKGELRCEER